MLVMRKPILVIQVCDEKNLNLQFLSEKFLAV